jgi:hypothetical protein
VEVDSSTLGTGVGVSSVFADVTFPMQKVDDVRLLVQVFPFAFAFASTFNLSSLLEIPSILLLLAVTISNVHIRMMSLKIHVTYDLTLRTICKSEKRCTPQRTSHPGKFVLNNR